MGGPKSPRSNNWPPPQTWSQSGGSEKGSELSPPISPRVAVAEALPAPVVPALWGPGSRSPHPPQFGGRADTPHAALPQALRLPPRLAQLLDQLRGEVEPSLQRYECCLQHSLAEDSFAAQGSGMLRMQKAGLGQRIPMRDQTSLMVDDRSDEMLLLDVSANTVRGEDELTGAAPWSGNDRIIEQRHWPDEPPKPHRPDKDSCSSAWAEAGIVMRNAHAKRSISDYEQGRQNSSPLPSELSKGSGNEAGFGAVPFDHVHGLERVIKAERATEMHRSIDDSIRQIIERPRRSPFLKRLSEFSFDAEPLVAPDSRLKRLQENWRYMFVRGLVIMMDTVLVIGEVSYSTHMVATRQQPQLLWLYPSVSAPLCLFFWFDMIFTLSMEFPKFDLFFGRTGQRFLNLLAILQQTLALIGAISMPARRFTSLYRAVVSRFSFLRIFRALLNLPGLGGKWLQKQIGELYIMIRALAGTVQPLVWCSVMVLIILIIYGTFFAESAAQRISNHYHWAVAPAEGSDEELLIESWGGLDRAVFTLFKAMLGGMDWGDAYDSLTTYKDPWLIKTGFIFFICFTYIAFLNTVTAVFIQCAFVRLEKDKSFAVQRELEEKINYLCTAQDLFKLLDEDEVGTIKLTNLVLHIQDPQVFSLFQRLQLDVEADQFQKMFVLMDTDRSGLVNMEEFMAGCLRLRGKATSLALELLHSDVKYMIRHMETIDSKLASQTQLLQTPREEPVSVERQAHQLVRLQHDLRILSTQLAAIERNVNLSIVRSEAEFELGDGVVTEPTMSL